MSRLLTLFALFSGLSTLRAQTPVAVPQQSEPVISYEAEVNWEQIDDIEGRFRILTPGPLEHKEDTLQTAVGQQVFHTYFFKVPDLQRAENLIYVLSYVDYPEGALHQDSTELVAELLSSTESAAAEALRGEVIYRTERAVQGYPGRLWRIDYKDGEATARTLACVIGNRYYELKTFALTGRGLGDPSDRFFRSFSYLGGPAAGR